jgi:hypothetical protein
VYLASLLAWSGVAIRLLVPILPVLYLFLYEGLLFCWSSLRQTLPIRRAGWLGVTVPGLVVAGMVGWNALRDVQDTRSTVPNRTDFVVGARWLAQNTPGNSVVMTEWPVLRYLYAGGQKMVDGPGSNATDADRLALIKSSKSDYVLIAPPHASSTVALDSAALEQQRFMRANPDLFELVFMDHEHNVSVYRVLSAG